MWGAQFLQTLSFWHFTLLPVFLCVCVCLYIHIYKYHMWEDSVLIPYWSGFCAYNQKRYKSWVLSTFTPRVACGFCLMILDFKWVTWKILGLILFTKHHHFKDFIWVSLILLLMINFLLILCHIWPKTEEKMLFVYKVISTDTKIPFFPFCRFSPSSVGKYDFFNLKLKLARFYFILFNGLELKEMESDLCLWGVSLILSLL